MRKILQIAIAILLVICLFDMPYGYYNLVRFASMVVFAILAYSYFKEDKSALGVTFAALALLFQPFFKIVLGKPLWNIVDVAVALLLMILCTNKNKKLS